MKAKEVVNPVTIACEVCLTEIPKSVNASSEADEYVSSFCGLECYQLWRDKQQVKKGN